MKISNLLFGANIKISERREDGTYKLADYTLAYSAQAWPCLSARTYTACAGSAATRSTPELNIMRYADWYKQQYNASAIRIEE